MSDSPYGESILISLRRIIHAIDLHSRELGTRFQLTVPQLVCLRELHSGGPCSPSDLSRKVFLTQATVTGILNRLETRGLIQRERIQTDRRLVTVSLTEKGREVVGRAPLPLQDRFSARLSALSREDQAYIDRVLAQVVNMMEAQELEAEPYMVCGSLAGESAERGKASGD